MAYNVLIMKEDQEMSENQISKVRLTWMIIILIYLSSVVSAQAINLPTSDIAQ